MDCLRYIRNILTLFVAMSLFACTNDDFQSLEGGRERVVTFCPTLSGEFGTRAIGNAAGIDELNVVVYEDDKQVFETTKEWIKANMTGVDLTLIEGRTYKILFFAQNSENSAYTIEGGKIKVDYTSYLAGGFSKMEQMDAFCGTSEITVGTGLLAQETITLSRPLAQLNFADNATQPVAGTHKAVVTIENAPIAYDPFAGTVETSSEAVTFTFADFTDETLFVDGSKYYYVSSNYLFVPNVGTASVKATLNLQNIDGTTIKEVVLNGVTLEKNKKSNVLGAIIQQPAEWSVWDGTTKSAPAVDAQNRYVIDEASDIAWLGENAQRLETDRTFVLTTDIDMAAKSGLSPINLPAGSTIDGGEHIIKGVRLNGALFGNATNLTVQQLTVEDIIISGASSHVGVLVNTLKGSSSFTDVTVTNSSATTTSGAAGGFVGYVVRTTEKERSETLNVTFNGCKLIGVTVAGSASEGKFVGLLSGYDNKESLTFDALCEADASTKVADYASVYTKANNSAWVTSDVTSKYDGWLGHEKYRRAKVTFGGVRMAPRWDGTTATAKADLLLYGGASNKYEVHSPFDLAGVRNATASPAALYLMENVDMYGQGVDGKYFVDSKFTKSACNSTDDNNFNAFSSIALLEGNNYGIYNVALNSKGSDRYAFILSGNNGDIHKNISFNNCCTVVPHIVGTDDEQTVDKSYGATVVLSISGAKYNMENVHAYGCKVFALQKTGIIAGRSASTTLATIENCSVNDCYIENYDCKEHKQDFYSIAEFYSPGEVGGFIGYIENFATIKNCHVKNTTIYAFGQDDQRVFIASIPGRHVGQFVGDIRTSGDEKDVIKLENCTISNTQCTKRWDKYNKCNMIGKVYYLNVLGIIQLDTKGTVTLDGKSIL